MLTQGGTEVLSLWAFRVVSGPSWRSTEDVAWAANPSRSEMGIPDAEISSAEI